MTIPARSYPQEPRVGTGRVPGFRAEETSITLIVGARKFHTTVECLSWDNENGSLAKAAHDIACQSPPVGELRTRSPELFEKIHDYLFGLNDCPPTPRTEEGLKELCMLRVEAESFGLTRLTAILDEEIRKCSVTLLLFNDSVQSVNGGMSSPFRVFVSGTYPSSSSPPVLTKSVHHYREWTVHGFERERYQEVEVVMAGFLDALSRLQQDTLAWAANLGSPEASNLSAVAANEARN